MNKMLEIILKEFTEIPEVEAIAIGGSTAAMTSDNNSDIDIYIFSKTGIQIAKRKDIIKPISSKYEIGGEYFGSGDEFLVDKINQQLDIMYWDVSWFENIIDNVWIKHYPSNGYTTCFLYTLKNFNIIYDKNNWLKSLQEKINTEYPLELQKNIIKRNLMLMKDKPFASYYEQLEKAINREDYVSINHRISAFLASYFDVIFAKNKLLHPGEKRLVNYALNNCKILPKDFKKYVEELSIGKIENKLQTAKRIVENLKDIL